MAVALAAGLLLLLLLLQTASLVARSSHGPTAVESAAEAMDVVVVCVGSAHARRVMTLVKSIRFHSPRPLHLHLLTDLATAASLKTLFDSWALPSLRAAYYMVEQQLDRKSVV